MPNEWLVHGEVGTSAQVRLNVLFLVWQAFRFVLESLKKKKRLYVVRLYESGVSASRDPGSQNVSQLIFRPASKTT